MNAFKVEKEAEIPDKPRKVTFVEEKQQEPLIGGSSGRQLVPGVLLVGDQTVSMIQVHWECFTIQYNDKELLFQEHTLLHVHI